jgi:hypothetical protein
MRARPGQEISQPGDSSSFMNSAPSEWIPQNGSRCEDLARSYLSLLSSEAGGNLHPKKIFWDCEGIDLGISPL